MKKKEKGKGKETQPGSLLALLSLWAGHVSKATESA